MSTPPSGIEKFQFPFGGHGFRRLHRVTNNLVNSEAVMQAGIFLFDGALKRQNRNLDPCFGGWRWHLAPPNLNK